ncbi:MAG: hypothetical protein WAT47_12165, partial [Nostocoides sp.]
MPTSTRPGARGILAPADTLDGWLPVVLFVLLASCVVRYLARHGVGASGLAVLAGAGALALVYASRRLWSGTSFSDRLGRRGGVAVGGSHSQRALVLVDRGALG